MSDDPRLDPRYDARLSELISDTADSVEPGEGLTAIRSRTRKETTMSSSRNWLYAVGGAVAGTAAVIIAIAVVSQLNDDDPTPAASSSPSASDSAGQPSESTAPTDAATDTPTSSAPTGTPVEAAVPVYYAGDSGRGHRAVPRVPARHRRRPGRAVRLRHGGRPAARPRLPDPVARRHRGHRVVRRRRDHASTSPVAHCTTSRRACRSATPSWRCSRSSTASRAPPANAPGCSSCSTVSAPTRCSGSPRRSR